MSRVAKNLNIAQITLSAVALVAVACKPTHGSDVHKIEVPKISIATYNTEGASDGSIVDFPPDFSSKYSNWVSARMFDIKAEHTAEAIRLAGSPDIVALQEVKYGNGSGATLNPLFSKLVEQGYKYKAFGSQNVPCTDTLAVVSKFPITSSRSLPFDSSTSPGAARDPLVVTVNVSGNIVQIYAIHARSKRTGQNDGAGDADRAAMMKLVRDDIDASRKRDRNLDIVVLGDFNMGHEEAPMVKSLGSTGEEERIVKNGNDEPLLFNLWYEMPPERRCAYVFKGKRDCLESILISSSLYDNSGFQYIANSFRIVGVDPGPARDALMNADGTPFSWQSVRKNIPTEPGKTRTFTEHVGVGYSDHLPIVADFTFKGRPWIPRQLWRTSFTTEMVAADEQLNAAVPFCTTPEGLPLQPNEILKISPKLDFLASSVRDKCFALSAADAPIVIEPIVPTTADTRYGFSFIHENTVSFVAIAPQRDDLRPTVMRKVMGEQFMSALESAARDASKQGKQLLITKMDGRLGWADGQLTLFIERNPEFKMSD